MFRIVFATSLFLLFAFTAKSQFSFGLKGGLSTQVNKPKSIDLGVDSIFSFGVDRLRTGAQFGAYVRLGGKVFIQPELLFNSSKTDFKVGDMGDVFTTRYQNITVPLLVGFTTGPIRFHGGPVGHVFINNKSDLKDVEENFNNMDFGWLAGLTIGKGRISADLRYEGNFGNRSGFSFAGKEYDFTGNPNRFVVNLNIKLL
jgi:hypothetical protein